MIDLSSVFRQVDTVPRKPALKLPLKRTKVSSINSETFVQSKPNSTTSKIPENAKLGNSSFTSNSEKKERLITALRAKPKSLVPGEDPPTGGLRATGGNLTAPRS